MNQSDTTQVADACCNDCNGDDALRIIEMLKLNRNKLFNKSADVFFERKQENNRSR